MVNPKVTQTQKKCVFWSMSSSHYFCAEAAHSACHCSRGWPRSAHCSISCLMQELVLVDLKVFSFIHSLCLPLFILSSSFARDLEARAQNEFFRAFFRLPRQEKLHAVVDCSLWTPFSRCHTVGQMFTSDSYICFASKEDGCCNVILPLREVGRGTGGMLRARLCLLRMGIWKEAWSEFDHYQLGHCFFYCMAA